MPKDPFADFTNEQRIDVPASLWPLEGHITIPIFLPPARFHAFWQRVQAQPPDGDGHHMVLSTYTTRLPLLVRAELTFLGQPLPLPEDGRELPAQEIAAFIVNATQPLVTAATRGPNLPAPSRPGLTAPDR